VDTRHTGKTVEDVQVMSPYLHYENGEGIHHLPEVGAVCYLATPNDNTPPFILGYIGVPSVTNSLDSSPERPSPDAEGSNTDVSFKSRRIDMNPGDLAFTGRDENFVILRRGGVLQIGSTPVSQRFYIPVLNYIKDFCENYELNTFAGDVAWTVARQEEDPSGKAPSSYVFHLNEFAQDANATVRVRYLPLVSPGGTKTAWDISVAPQGINRDDGTVSNEVYNLLITTSGDKTEMIGAGRSIEITGDDNLSITGNRSVTIEGNETVEVDQSISIVAGLNHVIGGSTVKIGSDKAASSAVKGTELAQLLGSAVWPVATVGGAMVAKPSAAWVLALQNALSNKVFVE
jgi:hypothetical protein